MWLLLVHDRWQTHRRTTVGPMQCKELRCTPKVEKLPHIERHTAPRQPLSVKKLGLDSAHAPRSGNAVPVKYVSWLDRRRSVDLLLFAACRSYYSAPDCFLGDEGYINRCSSYKWTFSALSWNPWCAVLCIITLQLIASFL